MIPPIYYMRDNHTFKKLTEDVEIAISEIVVEMNAGYTCGSLCTKRTERVPMCHFTDRIPRAVMLERARVWLNQELAARKHGAAVVEKP